MKKSLLILAIILCANIIYAQTEKGTLYISGSTMLDLSFDSQTFENGEKIENDITNISFIPSIGIFIIDNMVVGLDLMYTHAKEDPKDGVEMKETSFAIMPMVRYYIPMENDFRPFIHAGIGWIKWKADVEEGVEVDADGMVFGGGAGISYFVKDNISLDLGVNYLYSKKSGDFMGEDWDLKRQHNEYYLWNVHILQLAKLNLRKEKNILTARYTFSHKTKINGGINYASVYLPHDLIPG